MGKVTPRPGTGARACLAAALLLLSTSCASRSARLDRFAGHWFGSVTAQGQSLPFWIDVERRGEALEVRFSSPDMLLLDVAVLDVSAEGRTLRFRIPDDDAPPEIALELRGESLTGTLAVTGGASAALGDRPPRIRLERGTRAPAPYGVDTLRVRSGAVSLAATRFTPPGPGRHPGVLLVHGSSVQTRDGYYGWADRFARAGYVTLVWDKRGRGGSTGSLERATVDDLVGDALAALTALGRTPGVDAGRVLVWGISMGGMLAPEIAIRGGGAGVIAVSAPGVGIGDAAAYQDSVRVVRAGFPEREGANAAAAQRELTEWAEGARTGGEVAMMMQRVAALPWRRRVAIPNALPTEAERQTWYWAMRARDPLAWWRRMSQPALLVYGQRDALVPPRLSLVLIQDALASSGAGTAEAHVFADAGHALRLETAGSGARFEWPRLAPGAVDTMLAWMERVTR